MSVSEKRRWGERAGTGGGQEEPEKEGREGGRERVGGVCVCVTPCLPMSVWCVSRDQGLCAHSYTFLRKLPAPGAAQAGLWGLLSSDCLQSTAGPPSVKAEDQEAPQGPAPLGRARFRSGCRKVGSALDGGVLPRDRGAHVSWVFSEQHHLCRQQLEADSPSRLREGGCWDLGTALGP